MLSLLFLLSSSYILGEALGFGGKDDGEGQGYKVERVVRCHSDQ